MGFAVGSLVNARGREWVVLPESTDDLLMLRPLAGTDEEIAGIYLPLEEIKKPCQQGEIPLNISRFDPGKIEPASKPAPILRLLCL